MLLRKPRVKAEVYNDLYREVVSLFRLLRDKEKAEQLVEALTLTPFSREEFEAALEANADPVEQARRLIIRSHQGFGSDSVFNRTTGFRASSTRSGTTPAMDWRHYPDCLRLAIDRLSGVVIEQRPALQVIQDHDSPETLFYVDPPYVHSTRSQGSPNSKKHRYSFEMTDQEHVDLAAMLSEITGFAIVSGYPCDLYDDVYRDWVCIRKSTHADGARDRIECLWLSPSVVRAGMAGLQMEDAT